MAQPRQDQAAGRHLAGADALVQLSGGDRHQDADHAGDGVHGEDQALFNLQTLRHRGRDDVGAIGEESAVAEEDQQAKEQQKPAPGPEASFCLFQTFCPSCGTRAAASGVRPPRIFHDIPERPLREPVYPLQIFFGNI